MSTRAVYSFTDQYDTHHVYKHYDGYVSGACKSIKNALKCAWPLPRFESDEFAAAFVTANKPARGGDVRLLHSGDWKKVSPADIEYRYEVRCVDGKLFVEAMSATQDCETNEWVVSQLFYGTLEEFDKFAREFEESARVRSAT